MNGLFAVCALLVAGVLGTLSTALMRPLVAVIRLPARVPKTRVTSTSTMASERARRRAVRARLDAEIARL